MDEKPCTCGPGEGRDAQGRDPECEAGMTPEESPASLEVGGTFLAGWPMVFARTAQCGGDNV